MKKWLMTGALVAVALVPLRADVTLVQTWTMEGPMAGVAGGQMPKVTMRIKGQKARYEMEMPQTSIVSITDLALKQVIMLNPQAKTAQVITPASVKAGEASLTMPQVEASFKPTGKTQAIDGQSCDEYQFTMTLSMAEMSGEQMPPEAAAMMKDVRMVMNGSMWIAKAAPGAAEFSAFNKGAIDSHLFAALSGLKPGQSGGMDRVFSAMASASGIPYLTEVTMTAEGTGPMVEAMKQMGGGMKMVQRTTSVSTSAVPDDMFKVPEGYTIEKK